jgi:hypothetical protein
MVVSVVKERDKLLLFYLLAIHLGATPPLYVSTIGAFLTIKRINT